MRGKIPQFSYNVEEDFDVRLRDVEPKSKMETYGEGECYEIRSQ